MHALLVFVVQFTYVLLLGLQSRHVRDSQYLSAAWTSLTLGMMGLFITSSIARAAIEGSDWWLWIAYVAAGPTGICTAIYLHDRRCGG
jgi:ABC-type phosphate transport system permease subunit